MSKDFQRIEKGVSIAIGKPLTWLCFLIWLACRWCFAQTCRFGSWLRQRITKPGVPTKLPAREAKRPLRFR